MSILPSSRDIAADLSKGLSTCLGPEATRQARARRSDVVVVTLNHRLGAFGYMYLGAITRADDAVAANPGMLDLVAALQ